MERRWILFFSPNLNPNSLSLNSVWQNEVLQPQSGQQHVPYYNLYVVFWASGIVASISHLLGKYLSHQAWSQSCWSHGLVVRDSFTASREKLLKLMFTYFVSFTFLLLAFPFIFPVLARKRKLCSYICQQEMAITLKLLSLSSTVRVGSCVCKISQLTMGSPATQNLQRVFSDCLYSKRSQEAWLNTGLLSPQMPKSALITVVASRHYYIREQVSPKACVTAPCIVLSTLRCNT